VSEVVPNKRIKLTRQSVAARMSRGARSLSAVRWADRREDVGVREGMR
jgi:hypothetical protein